MKRITIAILSLVLCSLTAGCGNGDSDNQANVEAPPASVVVRSVRRATVPITEDYEGTIGAVQQVEIRARVQGTLDRAPFKEGDLVRKGDLIFQVQ